MACRAALLALMLLATGCEAPSSTSHPASTSGPRWIPPLGNVPWQWELATPLDLSNQSLMGIGVKTYTGRMAPDPVVYDIDGFQNSAATVAALHAHGAHVICYIEIGAAENHRPDFSSFPASTLGSAVQDYPDERYVDIRSAAVLNIIKSRITMCARKRFDSIEPDIDDSYAKDTGFPLVLNDDVAFNSALAAFAHSLGLSYGLKNGDDPVYAGRMLSMVDFALDEQCFEFETCGAFFPAFRDARKAVFEVEYRLPTSRFCEQALVYEFNAVKHDVNLAGGREPCS